MDKDDVCVGVPIGQPFPEIGKPLMLVGFGDKVFTPEVITRIEWKIYDDIKEAMVFMKGF